MTKLQAPSLTQVKLRSPFEGSMLRLCQALDFNCVRLPYSLEMHLDQPDVRSGYRISPSTETHPQRGTQIVCKGISRFRQSFWIQKWNIHLIPVTNWLKSLNLVNTKVAPRKKLQLTIIWMDVFLSHARPSAESVAANPEFLSLGWWSMVSLKSWSHIKIYCFTLVICCSSPRWYRGGMSFVLPMIPMPSFRELRNMSVLKILNATIHALATARIMIILNNHQAGDLFSSKCALWWTHVEWCTGAGALCCEV